MKYYLKTILQYYLKAMRQYAVFRGRADRFEFWLFTLTFFFLIGLSAIPDFIFNDGDMVNRIPWFGTIVGLVHVIPFLSVEIRRLHDIGMSGWWWWVGIVPYAGPVMLFVFYCIRGNAGPNKYGLDPYAVPTELKPLASEGFSYVEKTTGKKIS